MPCRPAICSHSLGRAWVHNLPCKLDAAAEHGFDIELFYEDLFYVANDLPGGASHANLIRAAHVVRSLCDARGLKIICLQPFMHYEGLKDRQRHTERIVEMQLWIRLAKIFGTNLIALPSTFLPASEASGDMDLIVADMREIADLGAPEGVQFAYEALCWGTHTDTWECSWEVVQRVDRANFGICLDTFNIAGRIFADPASATGRNPNAERNIQLSLDRLVRTVDVRKIAYVQCVDAERLASPLVEGHELFDPAQPARMSWSRNCRLFYGEHDRGAYLPVKAILEAIIVGLGFDGYISAEVFSRALEDSSPTAPAELAWRAAISWQKIESDFDLVEMAPLPGFLKRSANELPPRAQL